jgi:anti-anti-sigma factor
VHERKLYQSVVDAFRREVLAQIAAGRKRLVVDLSSVDVMNSSALGVIILAHDRLSKEGGRLALAGPNPMLRELFMRMHLNDLFPLTGSVEEGIREVSG